MSVRLELEVGYSPVAPSIIGMSAPIQRLREMIETVARTNLPVLVQGPTGAGKELVAAAVHSESRRRGAFVAFNVCAISDTMFEDALFGHVRGAFTGAVHDSPGFLREANGGTVFMDEVSGLAPVLQAKLLRAVETGVFRPVGAARDAQSEFRVVAATNERLDVLVQKGQFRADLAHRLSAVSLFVPALADRREDIPHLVQHFLGRLGVVSAAREPMELLLEHSWPGNVRELKHVVECAVAFGNGDLTLYSVRLALSQRQHAHAAMADRDAGARRELHQILVQCQWNTEDAAEQLGVHRATLYRRMKKLGLSQTHTPASLHSR